MATKRRCEAGRVFKIFPKDIIAIHDEVDCGPAKLAGEPRRQRAAQRWKNGLKLSHGFQLRDCRIAECRQIHVV